MLKAELMILFDTIQAAEVGGEEPGPISGIHSDLAVVGANQLRDAAFC